MHANYYFLKQLCHQLQKKVVGMTLSVCFSQNKDELTLGGYIDKDREGYLRIHVSNELCMLNFAQGFSRARKNTADLFPELLGKKITSIDVFDNDRVFFIQFEGEYRLVGKMFGNAANVLIYKGEVVVDIFRKNRNQDKDVQFSEWGKKISPSLDSFKEEGWKTCFPAAGPELRSYFENKYPENEQCYKAFYNWSQTNHEVYIYEKEPHTIKLLLFPPTEGTVLFRTEDSVEASDVFFHSFIKHHHFAQIKKQAVKLINDKINKINTYIEKAGARLYQLENELRYEEFGHLIMAQMHLILPNTEKVILEDYYKGGTIELTIKPQLSPQKNAEQFYRKAKNQKIEIQKIKENISKKEEEWHSLQFSLEELEVFSELKNLKKYTEKFGLQKKDQQLISLPYRSFEWEGFQIWVGKGSSQNDELTQKYSYKEDLWLHARDVAGSHVLLKYQAGKSFPPSVIEKAAQLAAWYSKRKSDSLCPVIVTPKKFVRKPKGLPPGRVMVDKEEVKMVVPTPFDGLSSR